MKRCLIPADGFYEWKQEDEIRLMLGSEVTVKKFTPALKEQDSESLGRLLKPFPSERGIPRILKSWPSQLEFS